MTTTKNAGKFLVISITIRICGCTMWGALPNKAHPGCTRSHWIPPLGKCLLTLPQRPPRSRFWWKTHNNNSKPFKLAITYSRLKQKVLRFLYTKMDLLLSSLMQRALFECEMPRLKKKNLYTFLAIKRCQNPNLWDIPRGIFYFFVIFLCLQ